jgi:hypothetical protein
VYSRAFRKTMLENKGISFHFLTRVSPHRIYMCVCVCM